MQLEKTKKSWINTLSHTCIYILSINDDMNIRDTGMLCSFQVKCPVNSVFCVNEANVLYDVISLYSFFKNKFVTHWNWAWGVFTFNYFHSEWHGVEKLQALVMVLIKPNCWIIPLKEHHTATSMCSTAHICQAHPRSACRIRHSFTSSKRECVLLGKPNDSPLYLNQSGWKYNNLSNRGWLDNESTHCRVSRTKRSPVGHGAKQETRADEWVSFFPMVE